MSPKHLVGVRIPPGVPIMNNDDVVDLESMKHMDKLANSNEIYQHIVTALESAPVNDRDRLKRRLLYYLSAHIEKRF